MLNWLRSPTVWPLLVLSLLIIQVTSKLHQEFISLSDIILWSMVENLSIPVIVNSYVGIYCSVCFDIRYYVSGKAHYHSN